jgi:hypothetical protein
MRLCEYIDFASKRKPDDDPDAVNLRKANSNYRTASGYVCEDKESRATSAGATIFSLWRFAPLPAWDRLTSRNGSRTVNEHATIARAWLFGLQMGAVA